MAAAAVKSDSFSDKSFAAACFRLCDQLSQPRYLQHDPAQPRWDEQEAGVRQGIEPYGAVLREASCFLLGVSLYGT